MADDNEKKPSANDVLFAKEREGNETKPLKGNTQHDLKPKNAQRQGQAPRGMGPSGPGMGTAQPQQTMQKSLDQRSPEKTQDKDARPVAPKTEDKEVDAHYGKTHQLKDIDKESEKEKLKEERLARLKEERANEKNRGLGDEGR